MSLFQIVYVSSATRPFSDADLVALLAKSRKRNSELGVTGLLLYRDGNFMQALEGEEPAVRNVHSRLALDPRHTGLLTLLQGPVEARAFSGWSMGFRKLDSSEVKQEPGYSEFLNFDWRGAELQANPGRAMKLLHVFRQNIR
jgi:hypothetical protein